MRFKPRVTVVEPNQRLEWLGTMGIPGIFDGRHSFTLTPNKAGGTRLVQAEDFSGALVPFTGKLLEKTEAGFQAMNAALLARLEKIQTEPRTVEPVSAGRLPLDPPPNPTARGVSARPVVQVIG